MHWVQRLLMTFASSAVLFGISSSSRKPCTRCCSAFGLLSHQVSTLRSRHHHSLPPNSSPSSLLITRMNGKNLDEAVSGRSRRRSPLLFSVPTFHPQNIRSGSRHSSLWMPRVVSSSSPSSLSLQVSDDACDMMEDGGTTSQNWEEEEGDDDEADDEDDDDDDDEDDSTEMEQHRSKQDEQSAQLYDEYQSWMAAVEKSLSALSRKQKSLQRELEKASSMEAMVQRAELLTSHMYLFSNGVTSAVVQDWSSCNNDDANDEPKEVELTLDPDYDGSASAEANALFQQAKKLKRGSQVVQDLLQDTTKAVDALQEIQLDLQSCCSSDENDSGSDVVVDENRLRFLQDRLLRTSAQQPVMSFVAPSDQQKSKRKQQRPSNNHHQPGNSRKKKPVLGTPASNIRKFVSPSGHTVLVGRNRRGNDHLTFFIAKGNDIWMHSRGCPGAHVLIQQPRGGSAGVANQADLQFAADLAILYSDARSEVRFDVTTAQPKHLLKPQRAGPGAVKLRQEESVLTGYPENVVGITDENEKSSPMSNEYRFQDKAKHRKRTKEAAAAKRKKKKQQKKAAADARSKS